MDRRRILKGLGAVGALAVSRTAVGQLIPEGVLEPEHTRSPWAAYFNSGQTTNTQPTAIMNPLPPLGFAGPNFPNSQAPNLTSSAYGTYLAWIKTRTDPLHIGNRIGTELLIGSQLSGTGEVFTVRMIPAGYYPVIENSGGMREFSQTILSIIISNPSVPGQWVRFLAEPLVELANFTWQQIGVIINPGGGAPGSGPMWVQVTQMQQGSQYGPDLLQVYQVPTPGHGLTRPPNFWIPWSSSSLYLGSMPPTFGSQTLAQAIFSSYEGYMAQPFLETVTPTDAYTLAANPGWVYTRSGNAITNPILPDQLAPPAVHLSGPAGHFIYNHGEPPLDTLTLNPDQMFTIIPGGYNPLNFNGEVVIEDLNFIDQNVGDPFDKGIIGDVGGGDP